MSQVLSKRFLNIPPRGKTSPVCCKKLTAQRQLSNIWGGKAPALS